MTNIDDIVNSKINKYARAMEALAKGDEMKSFVPDELWDERMRLMSAQPIEAIDAWTKAAKMVSELKVQLASRDALIERLVEAGEWVAKNYDMLSWATTGTDYEKLVTVTKWQAIVAEYRASKDGGGE